MCRSLVLAVAISSGCWLASCSTKINMYTIPVREIDFPGYSGSLVCTPILGSSYDLMLFNMVDTASILIYHPMSTEYYYSVYDINTGEMKGNLCRRGNGPGEFQSVAGWNDIREGSMTMLNPITRYCYEMDISRSMVEGYLVYSRSSLIALDPNERHFPHPLYVIEDELVAYYSTAKVDVPYFAVYDLADGKKQKDYSIFKPLPTSGRSLQPAKTNVFMNTQVINADRSKICVAMARDPQINIIEALTGAGYGVRFRNVAEKKQGGEFYFRDVATDGKYIYALYIGGKMEDAVKSYLCVFDWDGVLKCSIELDRCYYQNRICGNRMFLSSNFMEDRTLYTLDLNCIKKIFDEKKKI